MKIRPSLFVPLLLASATFATAQFADLRVTTTVNQSKPLYGATIQFTVVVNNDGEDDATGVTVTDFLPSGYEFVSADAQVGSYNDLTGIWYIGNLGNGAAFVLDITAKVLTSGPYKYEAEVIGNEEDPELSNNTASVTPVPSWNLFWDGGTADIDPEVTPPDGFSEGGDGTWDATIKNWDPGAGTAGYLAWDNDTGYTANFAGATGIVALDTDIVAGKLAITGAYTIALGANTLTLNGTGTTIFGNAAIKISGTGALTLGSSQTWDNSSDTMTISAPVDTGSNLLTLGTRNNNLDVSGKISGDGGLTVNTSGITTALGAKNSGNVPTLNNANDYTGTTTLNGFIWLNSGGLGAFGSDTSDIILNTGGFRLSGTGTVTRGLDLTGKCDISKISGTTTFNGNISGTGNLNVSGNYTGAIGGAGAVVLGAANDFTGTASAGPDGTLRLAHVLALQNANFNTSPGLRSLLDLTTNNLAYVIGGLTGAGNLDLGSGLGDGGNGTVAIGNNDESKTYSGVLSGTAGLTKVGTGTQTLSGINTYTGNTTVNAGTLLLANNAGLKFVVTDDSANKVTGTNSGTVTLEGDFTIDTTAVTIASGSWTLVDVASVPTTFTDDFTVNDFTPDPDGVTWNHDAGARTWSFSETTGVLTLGGGALPAYDQWAIDNGLTALNNGKDLDPDSDGVKNILEFALGGDPLSGSDGGISLAKIQDVAGSPALTLTIATRAGTTFDTGSGARVGAINGISYRIEGGQDLATWTATITEVTPALTSGLPAIPPTGYEYHTFKTAGPVPGTPTDFIRVKVSE